MSEIQRLTPSKGASMHRDEDGPYVRYLDHVEQLARLEARNVHHRAAMSTIPLDTTAERLRSENTRLRDEVALLHARLRNLAAPAHRTEADAPAATLGNRS